MFRIPTSSLMMKRQGVGHSVVIMGTSFGIFTPRRFNVYAVRRTAFPPGVPVSSPNRTTLRLRRAMGNWPLVQYWSCAQGALGRRSPGYSLTQRMNVVSITVLLILVGYQPNDAESACVLLAEALQHMDNLAVWAVQNQRRIALLRKSAVEALTVMHGDLSYLPYGPLLPGVWKSR
jgi:hypothetical protein